MDTALVGRDIKVTNPTEEHRWLSGAKGVITKVDEEHFCYIVLIRRVDGVEHLVRLVRGEFELIAK